MRRPLLMSLVLLSCVCGTLRAGEECTTAVITGRAAADGRPLLWKNRDTDQLSNKVLLVRDTPYSYLAVTNAEDTSGRIAWGGVNAAGFAIINSVAYNLPLRGGESEDLEGLIMASALRTCGNVEDFERFVKLNLSPAFGSRANFCVIDAGGGAAIFEVHNHGYARLDAEQDPAGYLLNTNFSRSGPADQGMGYLRFDRETALFKQVPPGKVTPEFVLQTVARDLGHPLERRLEPSEWKTLTARTPTWVHTNHTIDRASTACAIMIQGVRKGEDPRRAVLWIIPGEPVTAIAVPLWVAAGETPPELHDGADAALVREAARIRGLARPLAARERKEYLDLTRLDNREGSGWLPAHLALERELLRETEDLRSRPISSEALLLFQRRAAQRALDALRAVR